MLDAIPQTALHKKAVHPSNDMGQSGVLIGTVGMARDCWQTHEDMVLTMGQHVSSLSMHATSLSSRQPLLTGLQHQP